MTISEASKSFRREDVSRAVSTLRDRLGISQARLADLVGPEVSMITVSRWERGILMPYPRNRQTLAEVAMKHRWWDVAAALDVELPSDEWLSAFEENLPEDYRRWMVLSMCSLNGGMFHPEDPENPTEEEIEIANKNAELTRIGEELIERLAVIHDGGSETIALPPNDHFRQFWWGFLEERQRRNGRAKKDGRRRNGKAKKSPR